MGSPNIVFIFADDMGYGDLSCQNPESRIQTPNLDAMAAQGMRFSDAHASSAVCTPSRYGVLTGRYCWRSALKKGVLWGYSGPLIEPGRLTLQKFLQTNGYHAACIGKWHLGWTWQTKDSAGGADAVRVAESGAGPGSEGARESSGKRADSPESHSHQNLEGPDPDDVDFSKPILDGPLTTGFDHFFGISASLDMPPYCYIEDDRVTAIPDGIIGDSPYNAYWREGPISPDFKHVDVLPALADKAVKYIESRAGSKNPFFLYFPLNGPHTPILPTAEFRGKSEAGDYGDFVMQCDHVVGRIMEALENARCGDNTLLIFASDNGAERIAYERALETGHYSMGPLRGLKRDVWEGGHRIPFVARWPAVIAPNSVNSKTICLTDMMATAADILESDVPVNAAEDSLSFLPALMNGTVGASGAGATHVSGNDRSQETAPQPRKSSHIAEREAIVHHSYSGKFAIRRDNWVLIDDPTGDDNLWNGEPRWLKDQRGYKAHDYPAELFDLDSDLAERRNLFADRPDIAAELKELLERYKTEGRSVKNSSRL